MGYDPSFFNALALRLTQLEEVVAELKANNAPRSEIVNAGVQAEKETTQVIGNAIESAYQRIQDEIDELKKLPVTPAINVMINKLISMKSQVPYHFTISQGDQEWLNQKINDILGVNSSS